MSDVLETWLEVSSDCMNITDLRFKQQRHDVIYCHCFGSFLLLLHLLLLQFTETRRWSSGCVASVPSLIEFFVLLGVTPHFSLISKTFIRVDHARRDGWMKTGSEKTKAKLACEKSPIGSLNRPQKKKV